MRHYDIQMVGVLPFTWQDAEMRPGEGKTLVADDRLPKRADQQVALPGDC